MIAIQFARLIANFEIFLQLSDDDELDPDDAVKCTEFLDASIHSLDHRFLREFADAFAVIANEYDGEEHDLVRDIPYYSSLEEELAADDPVRLAELEALREARGD